MNLHTDTCFKGENQLNQLNYSVNLVDNKVALPLHIQNLEKALNLNSFLKQVHSLIDDNRDDKLNLTLSKQQSKDVKSSMYSFNKTGKDKNWLKNILIDNSDESDDIGQEVEQLLKIRKNFKKNNKNQFNSINSNLSTNLLSLNDSVPLNSFFKNEKTCKNPIKKKKSTVNKKKLKSDENPIKSPDKPNNKLTDKLIDNLNDKLNETKEDKYQLTNYFEPTLNSKAFNKHHDDFIDAGCLDSKLLDDIKYESTLPDDILQSESNMNDFVNSFLTNMNDQIVYSNQLPDEIFETEEEEISNGFQSSTFAYDLNKLTNQDKTTIESVNKNIEIKPLIETIIKIEPNNETQISDQEQSSSINLMNGSTIQLINSSSSINQNLIPNSIASSIISQIPTINSSITPICAPINNTPIITSINQASQSTSNSSSSSISSVKTTIDIIKLSKSFIKKEKSGKSFLDMEPEQIMNRRRRVWLTIAKKEIPKAYKSRLLNKKEILNNCKKLANCAQRERKTVIGIPKLNKEKSSKKPNKEIATYKRNDNQEVKPHQLLPKVNETNLNETIIQQATTTIIINERTQEIKPNCLVHH